MNKLIHINAGGKMSTLKSILNTFPCEVRYDEIRDFENLDERISAVGVIYANTIGVSNGYVELSPDNEPPLIDEILSWIWVIRPDLGDEILKESDSDDFIFLIKSYQENKMGNWWDYISGD